jgi:hypothetical protein
MVGERGDLLSSLGAAMGVILFFAVVAAVLFPVIMPVHSYNRSISCLSNMKLIGLGLAQYEQDYDNRLPSRQTVNAAGKLLSWRLALFPYIKSTRVFQCPSDPAAGLPDVEHDGFPRSYAVNSTNAAAAQACDEVSQCTQGPFARPSLDVSEVPSSGADSIALVESSAAFDDFNLLLPGAFTYPPHPNTITGHLFGHVGFTNCGFIDGHAKALAMTEASLGGPSTPDLWTVDNAPLPPSQRATALKVMQYGKTQSSIDRLR